MIEVKELLDVKDKYIIYIDNVEVFCINDTESKTFDECLNVISLLKQMYDYGKDNKEVVFGICGKEV